MVIITFQMTSDRERVLYRFVGPGVPPFTMKFLLVFAMTVTLTASSSWAAELERQTIFKIERSTNANIIQYDVQLNADGKLDHKKPVVAYWVRLAEQGQIKKLSWLQRKFVYGFKVKRNRDADSVRLKMAAKLGRIINVTRRGDGFAAWIRIQNTEAWLDKIFIASSGSGTRSRVDYIELYGVDRNSGEKRYERFSP